MSRKSAAVALAAIALAGCGSSSTKHADPFAGFNKHPAAMHRWCNDYNTLLSTTGWTNNQLYNQLKDTGQINGLSLDTYKAQIRWCFAH